MLYDHLMKLSEYLDTAFPEEMPRWERRKVLATQIGCHRFYIYQLETGRRRGSPEMAARISQATGGKVGVADMIPALKDFQEPGGMAATPQEHPSPNPG